MKHNRSEEELHDLREIQAAKARELRIRENAIRIYAVFRADFEWNDDQAPKMMELAIKEAVEIENFLDKHFK